MLVIPAIDIIDGKCVRLTKGEYSSQKIYSEDVLALAQDFQSAGASYLHIIDLDAAKVGEPKNFNLISQICSELKIPIQVGGGIRNLETAAKYFEAGVDRIIIGTRAVNDLNFVSSLLREFGPEKIIISVDIKNGRVATDGWLNLSKKFEVFAEELSVLGVKNLLVTDISKDGTLSGPNFGLMSIFQDYGFSVIASGGVSSLQDLSQLRELGLSAAVVGKAIYEGNIELKDLFATRSDLSKRIIPCLDVKDGRVVKGVNFKGLIDAGDPVELAKKYVEQGADELVFLDITASQENRDNIYELVEKVSESVFIPFTVGGGVRSVNDARKLLEAGADKVAINTAAVENPNLITQMAEAFGSQCVVVAVDTKLVGNSYKVFIKGASKETDLELFEWLREVENLGAGEILLTSIDRDGTKSGFDNELLKRVSETLNIPIIASGGAGSKLDIKDAFLDGKADAVLAASVFHYDDFSVMDLKKYLSNYLTIRL